MRPPHFFPLYLIRWCIVGWLCSTVVLQLRLRGYRPVGCRLGGPPREALYSVALRGVR
jgi:hypothetical protein